MTEDSRIGQRNLHGYRSGRKVRGRWDSDGERDVPRERPHHDGDPVLVLDQSDVLMLVDGPFDLVDLHRDLNQFHHVPSADLVLLSADDLGLLDIVSLPPDYWLLDVLLPSHAIACSTFAPFLVVFVVLLLLVAVLWAWDWFEYTLVSLSEHGMWCREDCKNVDQSDI